MADEVPRDETVALLALLRAAPRGVTWGDIAGEVRLAGSALAVLEKTREAQGTLFPDPMLDEAVARVDAELAEWEAAGLDLVTVLSARYPTRLAGVFDCPPFLFVRGAVIPDDRGMSVVGSRKASPEGLAMAREAARLLDERGLTVIAGLAEGIDAAAHQEALRIGARTVAVIGTGIRQYSPASNRALQDEIAEKGLVISQFYPDQPPTKTTFPMRNGTMSGYGLATIVVEANEYSGSRIQARKAADHGRPVILSHKVVTSTEWGAEMAQNPWVAVANSREKLAEAIDQVISDSSDEFLKSLGLVSA
ncbi:MAG: DNA-protecting protein DprA [Propionibacteriaceae bacterium]|jgi:DNA processing protein|nr:DNA-protecting protein DprA [Propionibacteriaceae bacterium]